MAAKTWLAVGLIAGLCLGCRTFRSLERDRSVPDTFEAQWRAAADCVARVETGLRKESQIAIAKNGIGLAKRARELEPNRVEGYYWYALNIGLLADADRSYGMIAVAEMELALKRALELDETYDHAGPRRIMGIIHLRTPPPPMSIGSARKGLKMLERAAELAPDYPENQLYLAEALRDNGRREEACAAVRKVLEAPDWPGRKTESARWRADAAKLLTCEPAK